MGAIFAQTAAKFNAGISADNVSRLTRPQRLTRTKLMGDAL